MMVGTTLVSRMNNELLEAALTPTSTQPPYVDNPAALKGSGDLGCSSSFPETKVCGENGCFVSLDQNRQGVEGDGEDSIVSASEMNFSVDGSQLNNEPRNSITPSCASVSTMGSLSTSTISSTNDVKISSYENALASSLSNSPLEATTTDIGNGLGATDNALEATDNALEATDNAFEVTTTENDGSSTISTSGFQYQQQQYSSTQVQLPILPSSQSPATTTTSSVAAHQQQSTTSPHYTPLPNANGSQRSRKLCLGLSLICPDCRDPYPNIVENFSAGDLLCGDCGLVLGDRVIDTRSEWRTFYNSDDNRRPDPSRVGSATDDLLGATHVDSTVISQWDASSGSARELGRVHGRATNQKSEKQLFHAFREIQAMCERIGLQKVTSDSAKQLYKKVEDGKLLRGRASEAIMAACIYIGCRENGVTRTFKEVCDLAKVSKREIGRIYKILAPLLEAPAQQISLESYVIRFSSALGLSQEIKRAAPIVIKRVISMGILAGKSPVSIAAACLYFVNNLALEPASARGIATVAGCTEATLRNAYRLLYEFRYEIGKDLKMPRGVSSLTP